MNLRFMHSVMVNKRLPSVAPNWSDSQKERGEKGTVFFIIIIIVISSFYFHFYTETKALGAGVIQYNAVEQKSILKCWRRAVAGPDLG